MILEADSPTICRVNWQLESLASPWLGSGLRNRRLETQGGPGFLSKGTTRQEESLLALFRPSTDWTRPTHTGAVCSLQSIDLNANLI